MDGSGDSVLLGGSPETGLIAVSSSASLASSAAAAAQAAAEGNKTLYLGNLHPFVTEQTLQEVFAGLGGITELKVGRQGPGCVPTRGLSRGRPAPRCALSAPVLWHRLAAARPDVGPPPPPPACAPRRDAACCWCGLASLRLCCRGSPVWLGPRVLAS